MKLNVNFSSVGFGKLFQKPENVSDAVPDKEVILQVSSFLPQTVVSRSPPVEFKSIAELLGFEYVGYIIEKERFDTKNQEWIKTYWFKIKCFSRYKSGLWFYVSISHEICFESYNKKRC